MSTTTLTPEQQTQLDSLKARRDRVAELRQLAADHRTAFETEGLPVYQQSERLVNLQIDAFRSIVSTTDNLVRYYETAKADAARAIELLSTGQMTHGHFNQIGHQAPFDLTRETAKREAAINQGYAAGLTEEDLRLAATYISTIL